MFRIKICGITGAEDARLAAEAGADAVGLNFYPGSPRYVDPTAAEAIIAALPERVLKVGVFVNATAAEIGATAARLQLDLIQLHGDEPPEWLRDLVRAATANASRGIVKAFRVGSGGLADVMAYLDVCRGMNCLPRLVMFDARRGGAFGGTGQATDWDLAARYAASQDLPPLVLAGGLSAENIAEAIRQVRPAAVDVASGVESSPGRKDPVKVRAFVRAAQAAFDNLSLSG